MKSWLLKGADHILTMDDAGSELQGADIMLRGGIIEAVGHNLYADDAEILRCAGMVVTPGLVNAHHHLFQTLTRAVPGAQESTLFGWLRAHYPIWSRFGPDDVRISAAVGLVELAFSGCTTSADHLYIYPDGVRLEDTIEAASELGMRFHPTRGAMSVGQSRGGLPPDPLVEGEAAILEDWIRVIDAFHDPAPGAMVRIGLAPCAPYTVSRGLMRDAALLARDKGIRLHTHLAESAEDTAWTVATHGCRPLDYAADLGWTGPDVWLAQGVRLDGREIRILAATGTGLAHCPCSNCRLGAGIAPLRQMLDMGVRIGLGVDGSASNDRGSLTGEARQAMLLQRVQYGADAMSAREALRLATRGGADLLGRTDIGRIAPGMRADLAVWDASGIESAGSWDPAALLLAGPREVSHLFVEGRQLIRDGYLQTMDVGALARAQARSLARIRT